MSPQWAPDGQLPRVRVGPQRRQQHLPVRPGRRTTSIQLTDFYTGAQGITPLSPVLSWAQGGRPARLRVLRAEQVRRLQHHQSPGAQAPAVSRSRRRTASACWRRAVTPPLDTTRSLQVRGGGASAGRRRRLDLPDADRDSGRPARWSAPATPPDPWQPVSIAALLDSAELQPAGYQRVHPEAATGPGSRPITSPGRRSATRATTSGAGSIGGSAIALSDILGNHQLIFAGLHQRPGQRGPAAGGLRQPEQPDQLGRRASPRIRTTSWSRARSWSGTGRREHLRHQHPAPDRAVRLRVGVLSDQPVPAARGRAAVRQRGRCAPPDQRALQPGHRLPDRRCVHWRPTTGQASRYVQPNAGAGVRQLALRLRRAVLRPAATGSSSPRPWAAGTSPRSRPTTGATTGCSGPIVLASRAASISVGSGRMRSSSGSTPAAPSSIRGQHLGLVPRQRVPASRRPEHRDRAAPSSIGWSAPRSASATCELRLPATESVVRDACARSRRSRERCSTTSAWPGTATAPSAGSASRATTRPASARRSRLSASRFAPTSSASRSLRLDYCDPAGPAAGVAAYGRSVWGRRSRRGTAGRSGSGLSSRAERGICSPGLQ